MCIMVVLGGGGHTFEMFQILKKLKLKDVVYVINRDDWFSESKIKNQRCYKIIRPRKTAEYSLKVYLRFLLSFFNALVVLLYTRPKVIITNGPSIGVTVGLAAKLLNIPIIYVESICRVYGLSLAGRILLPFTKLFIVQWPMLRKYSKKIIYAGRIF
ncbi:MAG: PssD/Cps14F family polysaccharide biosynthesis glycosyltransferase [Candidatus Odinarchaeia archaeon]